MEYLINIFIIASFSFFWRVRGGLRINNEKAPANKIWFAVNFAGFAMYLNGFNFAQLITCFLVVYTSYQLFGYGTYLGALLSPESKKTPLTEKECELIDDIVLPRFENNPSWFGFIGTSLTGLIITFLIGSYFQNVWFMLSGLGMGACYLLADYICKLFKKDEGKNSWNLGEWIFGAYLGLMVILLLI